MLSETFRKNSQPLHEDETVVKNPESQQQNNLSSNHFFLFRKICYLIIHMNNLDKEEEEIIKNLDGQLVNDGS